MIKSLNPEYVSLWKMKNRYWNYNPYLKRNKFRTEMSKCSFRSSLLWLNWKKNIKISSLRNNFVNIMISSFVIIKSMPIWQRILEESSFNTKGINYEIN